MPDLKDLMPLAALIFSIGFTVPMLIASAAGGFILGSYALGQARKTVLGMYVRHWLTKRSPQKFFPEDFISDRVRRG
jgi:hypothetical protein